VAVNPPALPGAAAERFRYSFGVRTGQVLWVSGQVALNSGGEIVGGEDVEAQTTQVFENLSAVLEAAGGTLADVVSTTTYMTDRSHSAGINAVRTRYLIGPTPPTSTLLVVAGLARPELQVEISAIAVLGVN